MMRFSQMTVSISFGHVPENKLITFLWFNREENEIIGP